MVAGVGVVVTPPFTGRRASGHRSIVSRHTANGVGMGLTCSRHSAVSSMRELDVQRIAVGRLEAGGRTHQLAELDVLERRAEPLVVQRLHAGGAGAEP